MSSKALEHDTVTDASANQEFIGLTWQDANTAPPFETGSNKDAQFIGSYSSLAPNAHWLDSTDEAVGWALPKAAPYLTGGPSNLDAFGTTTHWPEIPLPIVESQELEPTVSDSNFDSAYVTQWWDQGSAAPQFAGLQHLGNSYPHDQFEPQASTAISAHSLSTPLPFIDSSVYAQPWLSTSTTAPYAHPLTEWHFPLMTHPNGAAVAPVQAQDLAPLCAPSKRPDPVPTRHIRPVFSAQTVSTLQRWLDEHQAHPYPTAAEKAQLAEQVGLNEKQVNNWFTNARKRQLTPMEAWLVSSSDEEAASEEDIRRAAESTPSNPDELRKVADRDASISDLDEDDMADQQETSGQAKPCEKLQALQPFSCAICQLRFMSLKQLVCHVKIHAATDPFQCTICNATYPNARGLSYHLKQVHREVRNTMTSGNNHASRPLRRRSSAHHSGSSAGSASSTSAISSGASSGGSAFSQCTDAVTAGPRRRGRKHRYGRSRIPKYSAPKETQEASPERSGANEDQSLGRNAADGERSLPVVAADGVRFQCTFCHIPLTSKSWKRHEETQHLPRTQWVCLAHGPTRKDGFTGLSKCVFCDTPSPTTAHTSTCHRALECFQKPEFERTFTRRDHLVQHIRNFHGLMMPRNVLKIWEVAVQYERHRWTCGFCGEELHSWERRGRHIAKHFREGMTMDKWTYGGGGENKKEIATTADGDEGNT